MKYEAIFIALLFIFTISGVIIALINNDFVIEKQFNFQIQSNKNELISNNKDAFDINKRLKEKEEELKKTEEERKKKLEDEIKKIIEEGYNKKEEEEKRKKEEEEKKIKEEERRKKEEEEKRKKEEEEKKKKQEDENRKKQEVEKRKKEEEEKKQKREDEKKKKEEEEKKKKEEEKKKKEEVNNKKQEELFAKAKSSNIHKFTEDGKLRIPCAYALDNGYVFPTLVAMTSLAENAGKNTFYDIYVMYGTGFKDENKKIILSVEEKHKEHCKIFFLDMGDKFSEAPSNKKITTPTYYRLELSSRLPDVNRIIWMDGDTAVFEDLTELITIDMKNYYIMGFLDSLPNAIERWGIKDATVLCAGVLLLDLEAIRVNHMQEKMYDFIKANLGKLNQHDQTVINVVCQNNIGPLPPKYGIWCFEAEIYALKHNERQRPWLKYDKQEFLHAYYHPAILHYVWPKPFWKRQKPVFNKEWWDYARKSGYYDDVYNKSPKWISNRLLTEMIYEVDTYHYHY